MRYLIILLVLCISCDIQRQVSKTDTTTDTHELLEHSTTRKGDTVSYKTVLHVKDTTIYTVNRQGTTLKTVYDKQGNISQVDCFSSTIAEILKYTKDMQVQEITKDKTEEYKIDLTPLYWMIGGLGFCLLLLGAYVITKK